MGITAINYDLYFKRQNLYFVSRRNFYIYIYIYLGSNLEVMSYFDHKKY